MGMLQVTSLLLVSITSLFVSKTSHCPRVQTHGGVVTIVVLLFTLNFGMKYAVVWMKNKKKGTSRQEAIFYNLEDAALWEQHINKTQHVKTDIIPIFTDA